MLWAKGYFEGFGVGEKEGMMGKRRDEGRRGFPKAAERAARSSARLSTPPCELFAYFFSFHISFRTTREDIISTDGTARSAG